MKWPSSPCIGPRFIGYYFRSITAHSLLTPVHPFRSDSMIPNHASIQQRQKGIRFFSGLTSSRPWRRFRWMGCESPPRVTRYWKMVQRHSKPADKTNRNSHLFILNRSIRSDQPHAMDTSPKSIAESLPITEHLLAPYSWNMFFAPRPKRKTWWLYITR